MVYDELQGLLLVEPGEVDMCTDLVNRGAVLAFKAAPEIIRESKGEIPGLEALLNIHSVFDDVIFQKVFFEVKTRSSGLSSRPLFSDPPDPGFEGEMACSVRPGTQSHAVDLQAFLEDGTYLPRNSFTGQERLPGLSGNFMRKKEVKSLAIRQVTTDKVDILE